MKQSHKFAVGVIASLGLGIAVATVYAQPGPMGGGMEHGKGGMQHGMKGGMGPSATGHGPAGQGAGHALMTPEERTALQEKMRNAKTPEERQKLAEATRTEMQKRAKEQGITLPEHRGPHFGGSPQAPSAN
jgi:Spy/CpxP family protein refolding chaperone